MPTARINDIDMYYEIHGEGFPIVLTHGSWADVSQWSEQMQALSQRYKIIVYDRRGSGRTEPKDVPHSAELWTEDLHQLMRHLEIEQAYIMGTSYGGMINLELILKHPEMVKAAIIVSGTSEGYVSSREPIVSFERRTPELPSVEVPTLIIQGENDTVFPPRLAEVMHEGIPNSELVIIAGAGHGVGREKPEEFNAAVLRFLEKVEAG